LAAQRTINEPPGETSPWVVRGSRLLSPFQAEFTIWRNQWGLKASAKAAPSSRFCVRQGACCHHPNILW
jgi:hypothetical protein